MPSKIPAALRYASSLSVHIPHGNVPAFPPSPHPTAEGRDTGQYTVPEQGRCNKVVPEHQIPRRQRHQQYP